MQLKQLFTEVYVGKNKRERIVSQRCSCLDKEMC